jgi:PmbA protein
MNDLGKNLRDKLDSLIGQVLPSGLTLEGWRFNLHVVNLLEVGIKNNRLGGPYTAPSLKTDTEGEVYLLWSDNKYSLGQIDRRVLEEFETNLDLWEKTAYLDPYGGGLVKPYNPPSIPLAQQEAVKITNGEFDIPFNLLEQGKKVLADYDCQKINSGVRISYDRGLTANSEGLWVMDEETPVEVFFEGDDLFSDYFVEKRLPTNKEFDCLLKYMGGTIEKLRRKTSFSTQGELFIIFPPKVFEAFLEHYLLSNLTGQLIAERQSFFDLEDFKKKKKLFRKDFTVRIDGTRPYRFNSYRCTEEGVSTGEIDLINAGRLSTPILNLKYAQKLDMKPTPIPVGGGRGLLVIVPDLMDLNTVIKKLDRGLIVHSVLGLHTQDFSSGKFSLKADQCLLIEKGKIKGKVEAVIAGDFLTGLNASDSIFAKFLQEENPAFCMRAQAF